MSDLSDQLLIGSSGVAMRRHGPAGAKAANLSIVELSGMFAGQLIEHAANMLFQRFWIAGDAGIHDQIEDCRILIGGQRQLRG